MPGIRSGERSNSQYSVVKNWLLRHRLRCPLIAVMAMTVYPLDAAATKALNIASKYKYVICNIPVWNRTSVRSMEVVE